MIKNATEEVKAKAEAWCAHNSKVARVEDKLKLRKELREAAKEIGLPDRFGLVRLMRAYGVYGMAFRPTRSSMLWSAAPQDFDDIVRFLQTKPRTDFRKSLKRQILAWLNDPHPRFGTPLTPIQLLYVKPFKPYQY